MAHFAIGDLQGCRREFQALLDAIEFGSDDHLWLLGDLVNRGPDNVGTMEAILSLGGQVTTVLGNHDLHFLAIYFGGHSPSRKDTFVDLLEDSRVDEYANWMTQQKLAHQDKLLGCFMSHAGVPHIWSLRKTLKLAAEVESAIRDRHPKISREQYFTELYGNEPDSWDEQLKGMSRLRMITNYLTRMRMVDDAGRLEFAHKGAPVDADPGWRPWYQFTARTDFEGTILFGHWAALDGATAEDNIVALDTGCVWGRTLTALCLETGVATAVDAIR